MLKKKIEDGYYELSYLFDFNIGRVGVCMGFYGVSNYVVNR